MLFLFYFCESNLIEIDGRDIEKRREEEKEEKEEEAEAEEEGEGNRKKKEEEGRPFSFVLGEA
ncbi:hypothetical protein V1478_010968 [Vespula squamosa]|uniref:Uncharacterized protein n=1 Tax=Vespula squamosa TaxID=30214 RepID=A0ABD2AFV4_VESSQ